MSEFKVGDEVETLVAKPIFGIDIGRIGEIESIGDMGIKVLINSRSIFFTSYELTRLNDQRIPIADK